MPIDKFGPVIAVQAPERDGKAVENVLEGLHGPLLSFVSERPELGPAGGDIGEAQGEGVFVGNEAAIVGDGVDFTKSGLFIVPPPKYPDRNLLFEEGSGPGGPRSFDFVPFPLPAQHPFDGGTADLRQFCPGLRRYPELDGQGGQVCPDQGDQPCAADPVKKLPDSHDGPFHRLIVEPLIRPFPAPLASNLDLHRLFPQAP
jgi:hypothetical protein